LWCNITPISAATSFRTIWHLIEPVWRYALSDLRQYRSPSSRSYSQICVTSSSSDLAGLPHTHAPVHGLWQEREQVVRDDLIIYEIILRLETRIGGVNSPIGKPFPGGVRRRPHESNCYETEPLSAPSPRLVLFARRALIAKAMILALRYKKSRAASDLDGWRKVFQTAYSSGPRFVPLLKPVS
jgi:hypothetical protein